MIRICLAAVLIGTLAPLAVAADRLAEYEKLDADYIAAEKQYYSAVLPEPSSTADKIKHYESFPLWSFLPKILELAQAQPDDEAAFKSCMWIVDRSGNVGNSEKPIFNADQKAWEILDKYHTQRDDLPMTCLRAVAYIGPAREKFLRDLRQRSDLSREKMGFATLALGEFMFRKQEVCAQKADQKTVALDEFDQYLKERESPEFGQDFLPANAAKFKVESRQLFREVQDRYADVPVTISAPLFRNLKNLGEKADKSLHALEHLTVGADAPNIVGKDLHGQPLDLHDYRGKVVVLSFWFSGCGPCMAMVPDEQKLVATHEGQPFALLGICSDETLDEAQQTIADRKIDWPCWFDGKAGPIVHDYNILHWPTICLLDQTGKIAAKDLRAEDLEAKIDELIKKAK